MQFSRSSCHSLPSNTLFTNLNSSLVRISKCDEGTTHFQKTALSKCTVPRANERNVIKQILELVTLDPRRLRDRHIITPKRGS
jgi:uncharacterized protein YjbI with pentapeptide repeats